MLLLLTVAPGASADDPVVRISKSVTDDLLVALEDFSCSTSGESLLGQGQFSVTGDPADSTRFRFALSYPVGDVVYTCTAGGWTDSVSIPTSAVGFAEWVDFGANLARVAVSPEVSEAEPGDPTDPPDIIGPEDSRSSCFFTATSVVGSDVGVPLVCAYAKAQVVNGGCRGAWILTWCALVGSATGSGIGVSLPGESIMTLAALSSQGKVEGCSFGMGDACGALDTSGEVRRVSRGELCGGSRAETQVHAVVNGVPIYAMAALARAEADECAD